MAGEHAPKVYVIDEARTVRTFVAGALAPLDVRVDEFDSGARAFAHLTADHAPPLPDLVVTETRLRDIDGLSMVQRLRAALGRTQVPILVFTTVNEASVRRAFLQAGADDYVIKPSDADRIRAKVRVLLENAQALRGEAGPLGTVLVADDDPAAVEALADTLRAAGYQVLCAAHGAAAAQLVDAAEVDLVLAAWDLPDQEGPDFARALLARPGAPAVALLDAQADPARLAQAQQAGVGRVLKKPVDPSQVTAALEELLHPVASLEHLVPEGRLRTRLLEGRRPFPPMLERGMWLALDRIERLLSRDAGPEGAQVLFAEDSVWMRAEDAPPQAAQSDREGGDLFDDRALRLAVRAGRLVDAQTVQALVARRAEDPAAVVGEDETPVDGFRVRCTHELGASLYERAPIEPDEVRALCGEGPLAARLVADGAQEALACVADLFAYLDLYFYAYEMQDTARASLLAHWVRTALLAVRMGEAYLAGRPPPDAQDRRVVLSLLGLCGLFHDIGLLEPAMPDQEAAAYLDEYAVHARLGYERLRAAALFDPVKAAVRDHHKDLRAWCSRFDALTGLVQAADVLDSLARADGMVALGDRTAPLPEPYSVDEALLVLDDYARAGRLRAEAVDLVRRALGS